MALGCSQTRNYYILAGIKEPFAKLLLAVAALRENNPVRARELLAELHRRFPDNELYSREINRIDTRAYGWSRQR